ncbi:MAG: ATP-binding protein [Fimbriiglobus sp.]
MPWSDVLGHDTIVNQLRSAYQQGRFGQAFLFVGPTGIGKRKFAYELAASLLCDAPVGPMDSCGKCASCVQVQAESHPDFLVARKPEDKAEFVVEEMRDYCRRMALKPTRGQRIVGLIENADDFNDESANAFLKTLEEPAPGSVLILLATASDQQLPTILSRTQLLRFHPLNEADLTQVLAKNEVTDPEQVARLLKLGRGSPGLALALADAVIWNFRQELLTRLTSNRPDSVGLAELCTKFVESAGKAGSLQRERGAMVFWFLLEFLRLTLHAVHRPDASQSLEARFASTRSVEKLLTQIEEVQKCEPMLSRYVPQGLIFEALFPKLLS